MTSLMAGANVKRAPDRAPAVLTVPAVPAVPASPAVLGVLTSPAVPGVPTGTVEVV